MTNPISPLMTPNALAARLGITPGILARWRVQGRGPRFIRVGGRVRYREEAVRTWLAEREYSSTGTSHLCP